MKNKNKAEFLALSHWFWPSQTEFQLYSFSLYMENKVRNSPVFFCFLTIDH